MLHSRLRIAELRLVPSSAPWRRINARATHAQPPFTALMAGVFLVDTGVGDVYSEDEARQWLAQTGRQALERKELAGPVSVIVAEARK